MIANLERCGFPTHEKRRSMNTDSEDMILVGLVVLIALSLLIGGFGLGIYAERLTWRNALPAQMEQLCLECAGIK